MDTPLVAYTLWLSFSADQRAKLTRLFDIPRTGESVVHVGEIMAGNIGAVQKQDGHRPEDLYAITTEKLQALIVTDDTDFYNMVQHVIDNLDDLYYEKFPEDKPTVPDAPAVDPVSPAPEPAAAPEFVPRDPEDLLKKDAVVDEKPKTKSYAKTRKAKAAETE